jgi:hypothetical protein
VARACAPTKPSLLHFPRQSMRWMLRAPARQPSCVHELFSRHADHEQEQRENVRPSRQEERPAEAISTLTPETERILCSRLPSVTACGPAGGWAHVAATAADCRRSQPDGREREERPDDGHPVHPPAAHPDERRQVQHVPPHERTSGCCRYLFPIAARRPTRDRRPGLRVLVG